AMNPLRLAFSTASRISLRSVAAGDGRRGLWAVGHHAQEPCELREGGARQGDPLLREIRVVPQHVRFGCPPCMSRLGIEGNDSPTALSLSLGADPDLAVASGSN